MPYNMEIIIITTIDYCDVTSLCVGSNSNRRMHSMHIQQRPYIAILKTF